MKKDIEGLYLLGSELETLVREISLLREETEIYLSNEDLEVGYIQKAISGIKDKIYQVQGEIDDMRDNVRKLQVEQYKKYS